MKGQTSEISVNRTDKHDRLPSSGSSPESTDVAAWSADGGLTWLTSVNVGPEKCSINQFLFIMRTCGINERKDVINPSKSYR